MNNIKTIDKNSIFDQYILERFCNEYSSKNPNKKFNMNESINIFRLLCFKMNFFMKYVTLPKFNKNSLYEAVLIEFRNFPHIEFLIRNTIFKLGPDWSHTIICGNLNYDMVETICKSISPDINIIKVDIDNMTQSKYSEFLTTMDFWTLLKGEKILIYQEDSIIFKNNIQDFIDYDFIGAPFLKNSNDTPNSVGNGGLSLRSKSIMIEVIKKIDPVSCNYNSSTVDYMKFVNLEFPPEDVYFSKCMQENMIGLVANWDIAYHFSSETVFNENSFGAHKFWCSDENWKTCIKKIFSFKIYKPRSNINKLLMYNNQVLSFNLNDKRGNAFDIDLYFFCKANNLQYINDTIALNYINKIALDGFIYHPKQLLNIYPKIMFYTFLDNIYVIEKYSIIEPLQQFVNNRLYNSNFNILSDSLINKKYSCLNDNYNILLLVFVGDEEIGIDLIERIIKYKKIQPEINVAFCFNSSKIIKNPNIKDTITNNFDFYAIYKCKELGSDITPTLLMYNDIIKKHKFEHIFKFHTKTISDNYLNLTNYLIKEPLKEFLMANKNYRDTSNCFGYPNYYIHLFTDIFNNELKKKYLSKINVNKQFVAGTIFYARAEVFDAVLDFVKKNNYRSFLLNNLYENNSINRDYSPNHFLERLFGVIKLD
jgi:hypothetical protein